MRDEDLEQAWAEAKEPAGDVPAGKYLAEIVNIKTRRSKDGHDLIMWEFSVIEGEYEGCKFIKFSAVKEGTSMGWLKKDLKTCGIQPKTLAEMRERLKDLLELRVEVNRVEGKGGQINTYINALVAAPDGTPF